VSSELGNWLRTIILYVWIIKRYRNNRKNTYTHVFHPKSLLCSVSRVRHDRDAFQYYHRTVISVRRVRRPSVSFGTRGTAQDEKQTVSKNVYGPFTFVRYARAILLLRYTRTRLLLDVPRKRVAAHTHTHTWHTWHTDGGLHGFGLGPRLDRA